MCSTPWKNGATDDFVAASECCETCGAGSSSFLLFIGGAMVSSMEEGPPEGQVQRV
jgi:hypothetical protein